MADHECDNVEVPICLLVQVFDALNDCHRLFAELGDEPSAAWVMASLDQLDDIRRRYTGESPSHESARVH